MFSGSFRVGSPVLCEPYRETIERRHGIETEFFTESIISMGFLRLNGILFKDITISIERDNRISVICS
jgi:hypothetical protein